jgi:hypothetical protein
VKGNPVRGMDLVMIGLTDSTKIKAFCKDRQADIFKKNKDLGEALCQTK